MKHAPDIPPAIEQPARVPKLGDAQREWIVRRLAVQDSPTAVRRDVRERFGIAVSRRAIAHYDPTRDPQRSKRWVDLFCTVRRDHAGSSADLTAGARQVERVVLRIVETLERRILEGAGAAAPGCAKHAGAITDEDRLRALMAFVAKLRVTDPAGAAEIRRTLFGDLAPQQQPGEA